jgi:hypothetical protein
MRDGEMIRRSWRFAGLVAMGAVVVLEATGRAAPTARRGDDADWPCQQRLMPSLGGAGLWSGPPLGDAGDWRSEAAVAELVNRIAPRSVPAEAGEAAITAFAEQLPPGADRPRLMTLVFAGLLEETNRERSEVIARLKELGRRQHELAEIASKAGEELRAIPVDATGDEAARRADLEQRFAFVTQAFESTQRTMRYACEAPVRLEARLGRLAQVVRNLL